MADAGAFFAQVDELKEEAEGVRDVLGLIGGEARHESLELIGAVSTAIAPNRFRATT